MSGDRYVVPWDWDTYEAPLPPVVVLAVHLATSDGLLWWVFGAPPPSPRRPSRRPGIAFTAWSPMPVPTPFIPVSTRRRWRGSGRRTGTGQRRAARRAAGGPRRPAGRVEPASADFAALTNLRAAPNKGAIQTRGLRKSAGSRVRPRRDVPVRAWPNERHQPPRSCLRRTRRQRLRARHRHVDRGGDDVHGREATLVDDRLPEPDGAINLVVAPHEFFLLRDDDDATVRATARCSIPICTEQPGTPWFLLSLGFCVGSPLVVDINTVGVDAIEREGFRAHRLQLGGVAALDRRNEGSADGEAARDIDVVFLGGATDRPAAALARLAPVLWDRRSELRMFTFSRPLTGDEPGIVFGDEKYRLLARSKVLVNLHRSDESDADGYFEWARMVEAMANGCVVVTEASLGHEPLIAGEHFVETALDDLPTAVLGVLDDDERRRRIAAAAHRVVMEDLAFGPAVADLLDLIERERLGFGVEPQGLRQRWAGRRPIVRGHKPPLLPVFDPYRSQRRAVHDQLLAEIAHRRELGRFRALLEYGDGDHVGQHATAAWQRTPPDGDAEVSVVVTLFNYADVVVETLDSIVASSDVDVEIVIVDDHSSDDGGTTVKGWMAANDHVAVLLLTSAANRGLPRARNLAIDHVRSDLVMMMDADNLVYPTCIRRLVDALAADPEAAFAYSTLEAFGAEPGLRSAAGVARSLVVRVELHRCPGDVATVDVGSPRRVSCRRHDLRVGGLGPLATDRRGGGIRRPCPRDARSVPYAARFDVVAHEPRRRRPARRPRRTVSIAPMARRATVVAWEWCRMSRNSSGCGAWSDHRRPCTSSCLPIATRRSGLPARPVRKRANCAVASSN